MNTSEEFKPFQPTYAGADALMSSKELTGQEARAAWLLWRNDKLRWNNGAFYDTKTGQWYGRAWLRGALQAQLDLSERQARRVLTGIIEKGVIEDRGGRLFFTPPVTNRPVTNRPDENRPVTNRPDENRPVINRPEERTQTVRKADTNRPESGHKPSAYPSYHHQPNTTPQNPGGSDTREESLEERERIESTRRAQADEERRRREQFNAETRAFLNTY
jgi:hypothetical protein